MKTSIQTRRRHFRRSHKIMALAASAALAVLLSASSSQAQYRVGSDGHARDANNRVGSGGYNAGGSPSSVSPYAVNGNQLGNNIVTGNVTAGREFRGFIPYTAAGAFSQDLPSLGVDRFVSQSAGVPIGVYNNNNAQNVTSYYGQSYGATPPAGSGVSNITDSSGQFLPSLPITRTLGDTRLGNPFTTSAIQLPQVGQTVMPGPLDNLQQPTVITASPLYGVRTWRSGDASDQAYLQTYTDVFDNPTTPKKQLDDASLQKMRGELNPPDSNLAGASALQNTPNNTSTTNNPNNANNAGPQIGNPLVPAGTPGANQNNDQPDMNRPMDRPFGDSQPQVQNQPLDTGSSNSALSNGLRTGETAGNRLMVNSPRLANTSPQYRELQSRFDQYRRGESQIAEMTQNRQRQAEQRAIDAAKTKEGAPGAAPGNTPPGMATPGNATPGNTLPSVTTPGANLPGAVAPTPGLSSTPAPNSGAAPMTLPPVVSKPKPVQIDSFAKDMKQSGAADLMKQAEQDMKDQKFTRALDKYDMVDEVTPNDPLVSLGRATAELGASYYTHADTHLREAFTRNPELLFGQYNLHMLIGEDRLQFLVKDLKDLTVRNKQDPRPAFLLAYIAYNTGNDKAAAYLDLADKRSGGKDPFFKLVRSHWTLPEESGAGATPDMNK